MTLVKLSIGKSEVYFFFISARLLSHVLTFVLAYFIKRENYKQRCSQGHKARDQGQGRRTQTQGVSNKKKVLKNFFQAIYKLSTIQKNSAVLGPRTEKILRT